MKKKLALRTIEGPIYEISRSGTREIIIPGINPNFPSNNKLEHLPQNKGNVNSAIIYILAAIILIAIHNATNAR